MVRIFVGVVRFFWCMTFFGGIYRNWRMIVELFFRGRGWISSCWCFVTILYFLIILSFFYLLQKYGYLTWCSFFCVIWQFFKVLFLLRIKKSGSNRTCSDIQAPVSMSFMNRSKNTTICKGNSVRLSSGRVPMEPKGIIYLYLPSSRIGQALKRSNSWPDKIGLSWRGSAGSTTEKTGRDIDLINSW